ncbi:hypothetical protein BLOT_010169, partial [Blomia tropicalis]
TSAQPIVIIFIFFILITKYGTNCKSTGTPGPCSKTGTYSKMVGLIITNAICKEFDTCFNCNYF